MWGICYDVFLEVFSVKGKGVLWFGECSYGFLEGWYECLSVDI